MKNHFPMTALATMALILALTTFASAADMRDAMWARQRSSVKNVLCCFSHNAPASDYEQHIFGIASAEINLLAYQVSPKDSRLVSMLAKDLKFPVDFPLLGWLLLKKQLLTEAGVTLTANEPTSISPIEIISLDRRFTGSLLVRY
jgi:hypothetical protein